MKVKVHITHEEEKIIEIDDKFKPIAKFNGRMNPGVEDFLFYEGLHEVEQKAGYRLDDSTADFIAYVTDAETGNLMYEL